MLHPQDETYYQIALSLAQGIGAKTANALIAHFGSAQAVLAAPRKTLLQIDGFGALRVNALQDKAIFEAAEKEMNFNLVNKVQVLTQADEAYPQRLLHCVDAPQILYYKGNATLNSAKTIAIVGTRKNTEYGQRLCNDLVESLAATPELCIISGLAHGIDTIAHKAALRHQLPTVGVMANGLHMIYPAANKNLAAEMLLNGGLLTEFASIAKLDKGNFPSRNRIVAGIADAIVVVESDIRGGALITAQLANSYNREVAAFPGRAYDSKSAGCNMLIRKNIASLITNADDLLELMNWSKQQKQSAIQTQLLLNLSDEEQILIDILQKKDITHTDELMQLSGQGSSVLASTLLMLEMQGLVKSLPGKHYRMN